jgi:hypothetical protein
MTGGFFVCNDQNWHLNGDYRRNGGASPPLSSVEVAEKTAQGAPFFVRANWTHASINTARNMALALELIRVI